MAEKGETRIIAIFTICIILISLSFSGCIGNDDENNKEKKEISLEYILKANIDNSFQYTLFFPAYQDIHRNFSDLNKDIIVKNGIVEINKINTKNGIALELSSNKSFIIELNMTYDYKIIDNFKGLSMQYINYTNNHFEGYWVYYNNQNISTNSIDLYFYEKELYQNSLRTFELSHSFNISGWEHINGKLESISWD
jgi:hypothetical protein